MRPTRYRPPRRLPTLAELALLCVLAAVVLAFVYFVGLLCGNLGICFDW